MQPDDRILCILLQDYPVGDTFKDWPLHITVIPWFRVGMSADELGAQLSQTLSLAEPFTLTVEGEAGFGYKGRKLVNLIAQPSPLDDIERKARSVLHDRAAWIVDETGKLAHRQYRPHITENKSGRVHDGETYQCENLYIIEQKGEYKEITGKISL